MKDYPTRYCEKCGTRMINGAWRGDQVEIMTPPDGAWRTYSSGFYFIDGTQKLVQIYECPRRTEWFFGRFNNGHDLRLLEGGLFLSGIRKLVK